MIVVAVNIRRNIRRPNSVIHATKRAWKLNLDNAKNSDFVIGVSNGNVEGRFKVLNAVRDRIQTNRISFKLRNCTSHERRIINNIIKGQNLGSVALTKKSLFEA